MKKAWLVTASTVALLILGGCGNKSANDGSTKSIEQLNSAISSDEFAKAQGLNLALINSGSKDGKESINAQLAYLTKAQSSIKANKYNKALTQLSKAQGAASSNKTINQKISKLIKSVKKKKVAFDSATAAVKSSQSKLTNKQYASALQALQPYLTSKYQRQAFHVVYTKVLRLQSKILLAEQSEPSTTKSTTNATTTSSKSTKTSSNDNTATNDNDNEYSSNSSSSASTSSSAISASDIAQARKDLTNAGENQQSWSDGDIETAIVNARKDGRTHIKASDLH